MFWNKKTLPQSGILRGFTDRHCHLLPGVDDGFKVPEKSLQALAEMEEQGVAEVWFTPHIMEDIPNQTADLRQRFEAFSQAYKGTIELHLAAENMIDNLFLERFEKNDLLTMENDMLLVETSYFNPPYDFIDTLERIKSAGYRPLLAHPERYKYMGAGDYDDLKNRGILFQLNLGSLTRCYSPDTEEKAHHLLKKGYYDFIGSDLHTLRQYQMIKSGKLSSSTLAAIKAIRCQL